MLTACQGGEPSPYRPGASDDEQAAAYVEELYGAEVSSLKEAREFIAFFWFETYDGLLTSVEDLGYDPLALKPLCFPATEYLVQHLRVETASSFPSLVAEESLLTDVLEDVQQQVNWLFEGDVPPTIDRRWCEAAEDQIREESKALPPP